MVIAASCGSDEKKSSTPYVEPEGDLGTPDMEPGLNNIDPLLECGGGVITFSSGPEFGFGLSPADGNLFQCTFEE